MSYFLPWFAVLYSFMPYNFFFQQSNNIFSSKGKNANLENLYIHILIKWVSQMSGHVHHQKLIIQFMRIHPTNIKIGLQAHSHTNMSNTFQT